MRGEPAAAFLRGEVRGCLGGVIGGCCARALPLLSPSLTPPPPPSTALLVRAKSYSVSTIPLSSSWSLVVGSASLRLPARATGGLPRVLEADRLLLLGARFLEGGPLLPPLAVVVAVAVAVAVDLGDRVVVLGDRVERFFGDRRGYTPI